MRNPTPGAAGRAPAEGPTPGAAGGVGPEDKPCRVAGFPRFARGAGPWDPGPPADSARLEGAPCFRVPAGPSTRRGLSPAFCSVGIPPHHWFIMSSETGNRHHDASNSGHIGSLRRFHARGVPVSCHGLEAERRVAEGLPASACLRRTTVSCACGICGGGEEEGDTLSPGPVPCSALWGPPCCGLVSVRVSRVLPGPPPPVPLGTSSAAPCTSGCTCVRCHKSHTLRQRVGVPLSRNIPSAR